MYNDAIFVLGVIRNMQDFLVFVTHHWALWALWLIILVLLIWNELRAEAGGLKKTKPTRSCFANE